MGYMNEFPHSTMFDSDLREILEIFQEVKEFPNKKLDLNYYNYVTPQMYGAKGNGVHNDTKALEEAINSGKGVFIPEGTYKLDYIQITGDRINILGKGIFDFKSSNGGIKINGNYNTIAGITIKGNLFESGDLTQTKSLLHLVGNYNLVNNCSFVGGNLSGIQVSGSGNIIKDSLFNKCNSHPVDGGDWGSIWFTNSTNDIEYTRNQIVGCTITEFDYSGICFIGNFSHTNIRDNCLIGQNTIYTMGIYMFAGALKQCTIIGNRIENIFNEGLALYETNNDIAEEVVVNGNAVVNCQLYGICYASNSEVLGGNIEISNNIIRGGCRYPIFLKKIKRAIITSNMIDSTAINDTNIYCIERVEDALISGNSLKGNGIGIFVGGNSIITNNVIINSGQGIRNLRLDSLVTISNNNFINCVEAIGECYNAFIMANSFKDCSTISTNTESILGYEKNVEIPPCFNGRLESGTTSITVYDGRENDIWIAIPIGQGSGVLSCNYDNISKIVNVSSTDEADNRAIKIIKLFNG